VVWGYRSRETLQKAGAVLLEVPPVPVPQHRLHHGLHRLRRLGDLGLQADDHPRRVVPVDPALLDRPMLQNVLAKQNIPYTAFKYAENTGQIQVIKEQTGTFADSIKLWGAE
jgi:hypothetical protein